MVRSDFDMNVERMYGGVFSLAGKTINRLDVDDRNSKICNNKQQAKLPPVSCCCS